MNFNISLVAKIYKEHESLEKPVTPGGNKLRTLSKYFILKWYYTIILDGTLKNNRKNILKLGLYILGIAFEITHS